LTKSTPKTPHINIIYKYLYLNTLIQPNTILSNKMFKFKKPTSKIQRTVIAGKYNSTVY